MYMNLIIFLLPPPTEYPGLNLVQLVASNSHSSQPSWHAKFK